MTDIVSKATGGGGLIPRSPIGLSFARRDRTTR